MMLLPRGPWCCEEGERLGVTVCPECAETSAAYQSCLGPGDEQENKLNLPTTLLSDLLQSPT